MESVLPATGGAVRLGITGTPGVGKSTFIDAFGTRLVDAGHRVAVLAVDPSSARTGGSILGDKTRMARLSVRPEAFIRPSPSGGLVGGVARHTRDALLLCEAAGYGVVIVETMGVGQAETAVAEICDLFLLLVGPGGGDDLQGIKRGVMELADVIAVNKADGDLAGPARHTAADYRQAISLVKPKWPELTTPVLTCSALTGDGLDEVWTTVSDAHRTLRSTGRLVTLRSGQAVAQMGRELDLLVAEWTRARPRFAAERRRLEGEVASARRSPSSAASDLIRLLAADAPTAQEP